MWKGGISYCRTFPWNTISSIILCLLLSSCHVSYNLLKWFVLCLFTLFLQGVWSWVSWHEGIRAWLDMYHTDETRLRCKCSFQRTALCVLWRELHGCPTCKHTHIHTCAFTIPPAQSPPLHSSRFLCCPSRPLDAQKHLLLIRATDNRSVITGCGQWAAVEPDPLSTPVTHISSLLQVHGSLEARFIFYSTFQQPFNSLCFT